MSVVLQTTINISLMLSLYFVITSLFFTVRTTQIPNFKWSQTNETILITAYYDPSKIVRLKGQAEIKMDNQDFTPRTKTEDITQEWLTLGWNDFELKLHLREDINPKESWCKWKDQYVVCSLKKRIPHIFDYLSTRDQIEELKRYGTKDWEATAVGEFVDEFEFDRIQALSLEELEELKEGGQSVIVRAFYPWCSKCRDEQEAFQILGKSKKIKKRKFKLGFIDAREDRLGAKALGAACGKCYFNVYYKGKDFRVEGKGKKKDFIEEIFLEIDDPFYKIKTEEKFEKLVKQGPTVSGYFEDFESETYKEWLAAAKEMKRNKDISFALLERTQPNWAKMLTGGANRVVLKNEGQTYLYKYDEENPKNFTSWIEVYSSPIFEKYDHKLKKKWESIGFDLPVVKVFLKDDEPAKKLKRRVLKVAEEFRSQLKFLYYPKNQDHYMTNVGLLKDIKPAFGISTSLKDDIAEHYAFYGKFTESNLRDHCTKFLNGEAKQTFKTQRDPYIGKESEEWKSGDVKTVVQTSFEQEVNQADLDVVLLMYKNWTSGRAEALDAFSATSILCKELEDLVFASYDYHENYYDYEKFSGKKHDSTLQMYYYSGQPRTRQAAEITKAKDEKWTVNDVVEFVAEHHPQGDQIRDLFQKFEEYQAEKRAQEAEDERLEQEKLREDARQKMESLKEKKERPELYGDDDSTEDTDSEEKEEL